MRKIIVKFGKIKSTLFFVFGGMIVSVILTILMAAIILPLFQIHLNIYYSIIMSVIIPLIAAPIVIYPITSLVLEIYESEKLIKDLNEYDNMTKAFRRNVGIDKLKELIEMNKRRHFMLSVCFIDINDLKKVNDTYGHEYGDALILDVVQSIQLNIRTDDFIVRIGGDEFLIVFNGIDSDLSEKIWHRIVQQFTQINSTNERPYTISVSHGIVEFNSNSILTIDELISEADKKMYEEKARMKSI